MFKNNIRIVRKKKKLTLEKLAELVGTSTAEIQRIESGKRRLTIKWINDLAKVLDCKPIDLVTEEIDLNGEKEAFSRLNKTLLEKIMEHLEILMRDEKLTITIQNQAKIIYIVYNHVIDEQKNNQKTNEDELNSSEIKDHVLLVMKTLRE